jgi:hypothetical protein
MCFFFCFDGYLQHRQVLCSAELQRSRARASRFQASQGLLRFRRPKRAPNIPQAWWVTQLAFWRGWTHWNLQGFCFECNLGGWGVLLSRASALWAGACQQNGQPSPHARPLLHTQPKSLKSVFRSSSGDNMLFGCKILTRWVNVCSTATMIEIATKYWNYPCISHMARAQVKWPVNLCPSVGANCCGVWTKFCEFGT